MDKVPYLLRMLTGFSLADAGPLGVFLLMVPESACLPVPSEITLLAAGFADQSHLTRHFTRTYGLTPGRWRALTLT